MRLQLPLRIADCGLRIGFTFLTMVLVAASVRPLGAEIIDRVLAIAAGELIMLSDVIARQGRSHAPLGT